MMCYSIMRLIQLLPLFYVCFIFFFKQKTAYEMRISDWSSDVCSSDLGSISREPAYQIAKASVIQLPTYGARHVPYVGTITLEQFPGWRSALDRKSVV